MPLSVSDNDLLITISTLITDFNTLNTVTYFAEDSDDEDDEDDEEDDNDTLDPKAAEFTSHYNIRQSGVSTASWYDDEAQPASPADSHQKVPPSIAPSNTPELEEISFDDQADLPPETAVQNTQEPEEVITKETLSIQLQFVIAQLSKLDFTDLNIRREFMAPLANLCEASCDPSLIDLTREKFRALSFNQLGKSIRLYSFEYYYRKRLEILNKQLKLSELMNADTLPQEKKVSELTRIMTGLNAYIQKNIEQLSNTLPALTTTPKNPRAETHTEDSVQDDAEDDTKTTVQISTQNNTEEQAENGENHQPQVQSQPKVTEGYFFPKDFLLVLGQAMGIIAQFYYENPKAQQKNIPHDLAFLELIEQVNRAENEIMAPEVKAQDPDNPYHADYPLETAALVNHLLFQHTLSSLNEISPKDEIEKTLEKFMPLITGIPSFLFNVISPYDFKVHWDALMKLASLAKNHDISVQEIQKALTQLTLYALEELFQSINKLYENKMLTPQDLEDAQSTIQSIDLRFACILKMPYREIVELLGKDSKNLEDLVLYHRFLSKRRQPFAMPEVQGFHKQFLTDSSKADVDKLHAQLIALIKNNQSRFPDNPFTIFEVNNQAWFNIIDNKKVHPELPIGHFLKLQQVVMLCRAEARFFWNKVSELPHDELNAYIKGLSELPHDKLNACIKGLSELPHDKLNACIKGLSELPHDKLNAYIDILEANLTKLINTKSSTSTREEFFTDFEFNHKIWFDLASNDKIAQTLPVDSYEKLKNIVMDCRRLANPHLKSAMEPAQPAQMLQASTAVTGNESPAPARQPRKSSFGSIVSVFTKRLGRTGSGDLQKKSRSPSLSSEEGYISDAHSSDNERDTNRFSHLTGRGSPVENQYPYSPKESAAYSPTTTKLSFLNRVRGCRASPANAAGTGHSSSLPVAATPAKQNVTPAEQQRERLGTMQLTSM